MPNLTTKTLTNTTLSPISGQSGTIPAQWRDTTAASYEQGAMLTSLVRQSSAKNMRSTYRYRVPIIRQVDGVDSVIAIATASVDLTLPKTTTSVERSKILSDLASLLVNADVIQSTSDVAPHY